VLWADPRRLASARRSSRRRWRHRHSARGANALTSQRWWQHLVLLCREVKNPPKQ
jgi:hypothetical protein